MLPVHRQVGNKMAKTHPDGEQVEQRFEESGEDHDPGVPVDHEIAFDKRAPASSTHTLKCGERHDPCY